MRRPMFSCGREAGAAGPIRDVGPKGGCRPDSGYSAGGRTASPVRASQQQAYIERVIGTIRRECLDHLILVHEAALHGHLKVFLGYYRGTRTHLSPERDAPEREGSV